MPPTEEGPDPVIAPSGMTFGSLQPGLLVRLVLDRGRVACEKGYLRELGERIRDVRQGPDGHLYLLTDAHDGRVLRLDPAPEGGHGRAQGRAARLIGWSRTTAGPSSRAGSCSEWLVIRLTLLAVQVPPGESSAQD